MKSASALTVVLVTTLWSCSGGVDQKPLPRDTSRESCGREVAGSRPTAGNVLSPETSPSQSERQVVYAFRSDLWVYNVTSDSQVRLTRDGASREELRPRFRDAHMVSFAAHWAPEDDEHPFGQDSLYEVDLRDGQAREVLRVPGEIVAHDWSPDGRRLAYLAGPSQALCLYDATQDKIALVRALPGLGGRGPHQGDEMSVFWSPRGTAILMVDTFLLTRGGSPPTAYVLDPNGREVAPPFTGTFARWFPDGRTALFREEEYGAFQKERGAVERWFTLDVTTGRTRRSRMPAATFRPAISPDGTLIAYDDGKTEPSLYVFDVSTGKSRRLARRYVAPVWLGEDLVAATATTKCTGGAECDFAPWTKRSATAGFDVERGTRRRLALRTTAPDAFLGNLDISGSS